MTTAAGTGSNNYNLSASVFGNGSTAPTGTVPITDTSKNNALLATGMLAAGCKGVYLPIYSNLAIAAPASGFVPLGIAVGDFNGDGIPDLAFGNADGSTVTILLGNGDGTFTASAVDRGPSVYAIALAVGDFNGDGIQDIAVQCEYINGGGGGIVDILLGNGDGTFSVKPGPTTVNPYFAYGIAVGDFNGDGIPDLALPNNYGINTVTVLLAENQMATTAATPISLSPGETHVVEANYAGDNNHSSSSSSATTLAEGSVSTTLTLSVTASTVTQPVTLTATLAPSSAQEYSTDGQAVTFRSGGLTGSILGTATLKSGVTTLIVTTFTAGSYTVSASFAGDAVFASSNTSAHFTLAAVSTTVLLKTNLSASIVGQPVTLTATLSSTNTYTAPASGNVTFTGCNSYAPNNALDLGTVTVSPGAMSVTVSTLPVGIDSIVAAYSGDLGDSAVDSNYVLEGVARAGRTPSALSLALTSSGAAVTSVSSGTPVTLTATATNSGAPVTRGTVIFCDISLSSNCAGSAVLGSAQLTSSGVAAVTLRLGIGAHSIQAVFNGAGSNGMAVSTLSPLTVTGKYATATIPTGMEYPGVQGVGPYGIPTPSGTVQIVDTSDSNCLLGTVQVIPDGSYDKSYSSAFFSSTPQAPATGTKPFAILAGDFNHDGIPDLAVANSGTNTVSLFLGKGDGTYQTQATYAVGNGAYSVAVGDLNGDGMTDMAVLNNTGDTVTVLLNESGPLATTYSFHPVGLVGTHLLEAVYSGDTNFNGSTSPTVNAPDASTKSANSD